MKLESLIRFKLLLFVFKRGSSGLTSGVGHWTDLHISTKALMMSFFLGLVWPDPSVGLDMILDVSQ